MKKHLPWLAFSLWSACAAPRPPRDPGAPPDLALLVGIDRYEQPTIGSVPDLAGAENDVARARDVLIERLGFAEDDVLLLGGERATHAGIVQAFHDHLLRRAQPGSRVVFWFSGHGSRTVDLSGVETSKTEDAGAGAFDNTLLAYDSRARDLDGSFDLVDDELHSLLRELAERTDQVLIVTDCCHSSGAVRGGGDAPPGVRAARAGSRPLTPATIAPFWPDDVAFHDDDDPEPMGRFPYVHFAACAETQEAGELRIGSRTYGTLSWFLCDALERVEPGTSWRALSERVRAAVAGCGTRPDQVVSAAGELDRAVFADATLLPLPGFRVDRTPEGLCIDMGRVHGLAEGALFDIVGLDSTPKGTARATAVGAAHTLAAWLAEPDGVSGKALRALPRGGATGFLPLRVAVGPGIDTALLADTQWATVVPPADAEFRLARDGDGAVLLDATSRRVRPMALERGAVIAALFRECTFRGLWEAVARPSSWRIGLEARAADGATQTLAAQRGLPLATVAPVPGTQSAMAVSAVPMSANDGGSLVTLVATNWSDRDLRITIVSLSEDRAVNIVWPRRSETDRIVRRGESVSVPVLVGPAVDWREGRPMVDRYLAFATTSPADFTAFRSDAPVWSASRGGGPAVPAFLGALLQGAVTRGDGPEVVSEFGIGWCDLLLTATRQ